MTGESEQFLRERLLPQPQLLEFTDGCLGWHGEPFALQLQGSCTTGLQQQVVSVLRHFTNARPVNAGFVLQPLVKEIPLRVRCEGEAIVLAGTASVTEQVASEAYRLQITPDVVHLHSATEPGVLRGLQTLAQILTHQRVLGTGELPCLRIEDAPAFGWRGLLIDVARHFIELPVLIRTLDGMAHHKLNVLHLHLTDDQAFRFPSTAYPKLNEPGPAYTRAELEQLVAHATGLGIRVVPELDMPGHTTCWLAAYPEWSLFEVEPTRRFGVHPGCLDPTNEETFTLIETLLAEFAEIFPDDCVHVGGDEVHPKWWREHPRVQAFMQANDFSAPRDLQAHFNQRVGAILEKLGKRMLLWDEAVHENLPKNALVQAWRGMTARDASIARGHQCIVSAPYYLDLFYPADIHTQFAPLQNLSDALATEDAMLEDERLAHVAGGLEWIRHWRDRSDDLAAGEIDSATLAQSVLGAEACLWSELVDNDLLDVRLWSRMPLVAELFWRGQTIGHEYTRVAHSLRSWRACGGPDFAPLANAPLSTDQIDLLAPLGIEARIADLLAVLEPTKWYSRLLGAQALEARIQGHEMPQARPYNTASALGSIACVISPQSFVAEELRELMERWRSAPLASPDHQLLGDWIDGWANQPRELATLSIREPAAQELSVLAARLSELADNLKELRKKFGQQKFDAEAARALDSQLDAWAIPEGELLLAPALVLLMLRNTVLREDASS